jgi:hypothetical protein
VIRKALIVLAALTSIGAGAGYAATMPVSSHHLWAGTQTLTKATCTVTGGTDTYVDENKPNQNNGNDTTLAVQPDTNKRRYALISFDLSTCSIPTTGGADTATLKLVATATPSASRTLTVTPITSTWTGSATWNSAPSYSGTSTTTFATGTANNATLSIPVTIDVDDFIKGTANYGWRIADLGPPTANDATTFSSSKAGSSKPQLVIGYEK